MVSLVSTADYFAAEPAEPEPMSAEPAEPEPAMSEPEPAGAAAGAGAGGGVGAAAAAEPAEPAMDGSAALSLPAAGSVAFFLQPATDLSESAATNAIERFFIYISGGYFLASL